MVDKKGFADLLAADPAILARQPRARVVLAGGGDLLEPLRRRAEELGIAGAVRFPGALEHPQALALIAECDVFVMPSVRDRRGNVDGLPIVVLEAMAAARPVVATAVSGLPLAIADRETGRLVAEHDSAALAAAVVELIEDAAGARRLGEAAAERVRTELNWPAVARVHDRLIQRAVGAER
jgi:glycosyltransferase involved in cell wall biosynthesis